MKCQVLVLAALSLIAPQLATAGEWVVGDVSIVEDYSALSASHGVLIQLINKSYYSGGDAPTNCTGRFRVVVGQESMTADIQARIYATAMAALVSGQKIRLFVNPSNVLSPGHCAVQIASIGDVVSP